MDVPESNEFVRVRATLAIRVRELRVARKLSQEALAHAAGCHPTYVSMIERRLGNPSLKVVASIADVLGVTFEELVKPDQTVS